MIEAILWWSGAVVMLVLGVRLSVVRKRAPRQRETPNVVQLRRISDRAHRKARA